MVWAHFKNENKIYPKMVWNART